MGQNSADRRRNSCIWRYDPPSAFDKVLNYLSGLTKFSQSNFTALTLGGVDTVCVSLYPLEKWFIRNKMKNEVILDLASNFALGIGAKRIDHIQEMQDYFADLLLQYDYYRQLDGKVFRIGGNKVRYKLVRSYDELVELRKQQDSTEIRTIAVIISIEGFHVLNTGLRKDPVEAEVLQNLNAIKDWEFRPFFVTIAHHFWNDLCGHAPSLTGVITKYANQDEGLDSGFTSLGWKVLERMLDNEEGKRILPDIKHMSVRARQEYYNFLESPERKGQDIPLIISHGACNGLRSVSDPVQAHPQTAAPLNPVAINFYDEEIIRLARSGGIIGLQLDERRIANKDTLKRTKRSIYRHKIMHYRSELLWNQVKHILTVLDAEGLFAWDCMALGTDFDGIIDSLNSFWTAEELPFLADFLERHAYNYMKKAELKVPENHIAADEIVQRIFSSNGHRFLSGYFR
ncbi:membrane dipeptidase [Muriicola marianensis]|uniref:membrane dipeptidase n=1 Tax=Muriicola marianensis TaxID=1324801 RepID=UPI001E4F7B76|nr:membrane dipeptidase [Muriicola marianensis]